MEIPEELKYSAEHEWIRVEGDVVHVGITDYAQEELGDVVFLELPEEGTELDQGESFGVVESVKAVSDLYSPVSGKVTEIHEALLDAPELINEYPYDDGWMVSIEISDPEELNGLMTADQYREHLEEAPEN